MNATSQLFTNPIYGEWAQKELLFMIYNADVSRSLGDVEDKLEGVTK